MDSRRQALLIKCQNCGYRWSSNVSVECPRCFPKAKEELYACSKCFKVISKEEAMRNTLNYIAPEKPPIPMCDKCANINWLSNPWED